MVKLNTDGSIICNLRNIGIGGVYRNSQGDLLFAFSSPLGNSTNNIAKLDVVVFGLSWCIQLSFNKVHLGMNSELAIKWINHHVLEAWLIDQIIHRLQIMTNNF